MWGPHIRPVPARFHKFLPCLFSHLSLHLLLPPSSFYGQLRPSCLTPQLTSPPLPMIPPIHPRHRTTCPDSGQRVGSQPSRVHSVLREKEARSLLKVTPGKQLTHSLSSTPTGRSCQGQGQLADHCPQKNLQEAGQVTPWGARPVGY